MYATCHPLPAPNYNSTPLPILPSPLPTDLSSRLSPSAMTIRSSVTSVTDESKPYTLSDPLLPPSLPSLTSSSSAAAGDDYPPPISYTHSPRPLRDLPSLLLFLLLSLSTFALGILSLVRHNPHHSQLSSYSFDPYSSSCALANSSRPLNSISIFSSSSHSYFNKHLIGALVATALLSPPLALALLSLLHRFAGQAVYASIPFFILLPSFLNVYWFVACALSDPCSAHFPLPYRILLLLFLFLIIGVFLWIIVANWHRVEITVRIVRIAAAALRDNVALVAVLPALGVVLALYFVPVVVFLVFARWNGKIVPRERGSGQYYCVWEEDQWVPAYIALAIVMMIWTATTMVEAQVYVISGTVAQWYFAKEGTKPRRSIRSSLRNAFGPSFGTVCFSGMVMGIIRVVRAIVDSAQHEENASGFVNLVLNCCAKFLLSAFDFVNKFTINFAAITGEAYCSSAKMTYELLKRNLLSAVFVETVSTWILVGIIFVLSALYAIAVFGILKAISSLGIEIYFVAALAWLLLIVVLGYFVLVLDNVIDTIYVCYAIDRDKGDVCKQEVHEVYVMLPVSRNHRRSVVNRTPMVV